jgi:magnesium-transporting ATPase (P-type)
MSGEEFRKTVGGMRKSLDSEGNYKMEIQNKKEFQQIANRLRVLGRSIPYDKHLLVVGLRELGKTVAVTGEGINDVDALRAADVGFAMGSGVSIAKDAADMILTNDNFEATMNAVMWGRNIYSNVKKFIQFQVTVNLAALAIVFLSAVFRGESVLNSVQLLWINSIIKTPPVRKGEQIMTPVIWRQIYGMSAYMIIVMMILMFFGEYMWDISYNKADDFYTEQKIGDDEVKVGTNKCIHYTILFHTFVFL